jgi:hypothetical protein
VSHISIELHPLSPPEAKYVVPWRSVNVQRVQTLARWPFKVVRWPVTGATISIVQSFPPQAIRHSLTITAQRVCYWCVFMDFMNWIEIFENEPTARVCPVHLSNKGGILLRLRQNS